MSEKIRELPEIIRKVGFDFSWDEKKVWALNVPVETIPTAELSWHLDIPFLWHAGGYYNLTPAAVLKNPGVYKEEYQRMMKADLSYPIDIMENKGRWLILDGLHRLMRTESQGLQTVHVRKIDRSLIPKIMK